MDGPVTDCYRCGVVCCVVVGLDIDDRQLLCTGCVVIVLVVV